MSRPVFTKRHFEAIAEVFRLYSDYPLTRKEEDYEVALITAFADLFGEHNERFDRDKFLTACGIATSDE